MAFAHKMAQGNKSEQVKLCCSVCLDPLKDPVTIPCGHSYCMSCINDHWNEEDPKEAYSCPQCRQTFVPRPVLVINTMLAELVKDLKKTGPQPAPADLCSAGPEGPEDVSCDVCTGKKLKAVKSCLVCLVSYCEQHLQPHYESSAFGKHKLVNPSKGLKGNICSTHNEVMKMFCCTDQRCICYLCCMNEHKGHETVPVEEERGEKEKELDVNLQKAQQIIQNREEEVKVLEKEREGIKQSADAAVKDSETIINELVSFIKGKGSNLKQQIKTQQKAEDSRVKELQKKLKEEITELRRMDEELQQLSHTEDHTEFLLNYSLTSKLNNYTDSPSFETCPVKYFEDLQTAVSGARDKLKAFLSEEWSKITLTVRSVDVLLPQAEPRSREEFMKYSCQLTLDPDTVHRKLFLSNQSRTVSDTAPNPNDYPSHKKRDRFSIQQQVLSKEGLIGPCYWEVEWTGKGVSVAVTYKNENKLEQSEFGSNNKSWALDCYSHSYKFRHNNVTTLISGPPSSKVGVYVDPRAGILSFYSISDTMTLLLKVQTTFTEPLYAGLWIWSAFWTPTTATLKEIK
ncbi:tripartite motif-containing protein 16-like [Archocentrus centrarchus]|uniref:tripartite motif-containing protein 16-like n=1 Tax=Archocentrus centrarchus TaxID=63155 RepID=UPI0011EA06CA|nr:tripartite motif-containing protein 16-like [Archocentrus centrarchus]